MSQVFPRLIGSSIVVPKKPLTEEDVLIYVVDWELSYIGSIEWDLGKSIQVLPSWWTTFHVQFSRSNVRRAIRTQAFQGNFPLIKILYYLSFCTFEMRYESNISIEYRCGNLAYRGSYGWLRQHPRGSSKALNIIESKYTSNTVTRLLRQQSIQVIIWSVGEPVLKAGARKSRFSFCQIHDHKVFIIQILNTY